MTERKLNFGMDHAWLAAEQSYAMKLKVGAAVFREGRCVCQGYNGTPPGTSNVCEDFVDETWVTRPEVEHAERNLISFAAKHGIPLAGTTMYITHAPCVPCARAIKSAGIVQVIYAEEYKTTRGSELLRSWGVECVRLDLAHQALKQRDAA